LRAALRRGGQGGLLVSSLTNVRWLCGFTGSAGSLLVTAREAVFFTDFRYRIQAQREVAGARVVEYPGRPLEAVAAEVKRARVRRLGIEAEHLTVAAHADLRAAAGGVELDPLKGVVEQARAVKDPTEVAAVRRALAASHRAFLATSRRLAGRRERDVADALGAAMRREGAEGEAFPSIIASGPRAALPHAVPTERRIRGGDLVIMDFGARRDGYCSDLTRTLLPGRGTAERRRIYRIVLEAQRAALASVRPGIPASAVDEAARRVIEQAGFGKEFGHGTGHGVGLEVHEKPSISHRSGEVLQPGMVFTVEPGIYVKDFGGVRIEDMVLVCQTGSEVLSRHVPKLTAC
jgi:Xaa-Pro aminopeptidase